jgi:hypothetical protein
MKAFILVDKKAEFLDGKVNFGVHGLDVNVFFPSLEAAMTYLEKYKRNGYCVCELEFLDDKEILEAVSAANYGNVKNNFHVKWLSVVEKRNLSA